MSRRARHRALAALFVLAAVGLQLPDAQFTSPPGTSPPVTPTPTSTPPTLSAAEIDRQDRVSRAHRQRETRAFDGRPLLAALPLELAGVRIDIAGLAADGRTTILAVTPGPRGRRYAEQLYRRAVAAYGDSGVAYEVRWRR